MARHLDVLVVESDRGVADDAGAALEAAGHRVHRCFDPGDDGLPCRAARGEGICPLDEGVDAALVVRGSEAGGPTALEIGASCAVRAGVPLAQQSAAGSDPYGAGLTTRVDDPDEVVAGCLAAADAAIADLRRAVLSRIKTVLSGLGPETRFGCDIERDSHQLIVRLSGPPVTGQVRHALAVRVLDAVWASQGTVGEVDVHYHAAEPVEPSPR